MTATTDTLAPARPTAPLPTASNSPVTDPRLWRISRIELERRWALVRAHLERQGLDALIVQGYEEKIGGNARWLTDQQTGYPRTLIFHRNDLMTAIDHGPQGERRRLDGSDLNRPGIGEAITNWALFGGHFTSGLAAQDAAMVIRERGYREVGLVAPRTMAHAFMSDLKEALGSAVRFSDETEFFDAAKAAKSEEELTLIRRTAHMQDEVFTKLLAWIRPGMRDFEINAFAEHQMQLLGSERGVYIGLSAPHGKPAVFGYRSLQGRTMGQGDHMNVLLESNGTGGEWTELGRMISFGKVPASTREAHDVCVEAQALSASLCVAGASPAEIAATFNAFMVKHGSEPEKRLHSHGQGYDAVERPLIRADETMKLPGNVNLAIHPCYGAGTTFATLCDNFVVAPAGPGHFLHRTPKQIFEL